MNFWGGSEPLHLCLVRKTVTCLHGCRNSVASTSPLDTMNTEGSSHAGPATWLAAWVPVAGQHLSISSLARHPFLGGFGVLRSGLSCLCVALL